MGYEIKSEVIFSENEKEVVDKFAHVLSEKFNAYTLGGFNVAFDLYNTQLKMLKHNCVPVAIFPDKPWDACDIRDMINFGDRTKSGTLEYFLELFGIEGKSNGFTGSDVHDMVVEKRWDDLIEYSRQDAIAEMNLFLAVNSMKKKGFKKDSILIFDIETCFDKTKIEDKDIMLAKELTRLNKKYKRKSDIDKNFKLFEEKLESGEYLRDWALDSTKNKIIAISYSWLEWVA